MEDKEIISKYELMIFSDGSIKIVAIDGLNKKNKVVKQGSSTRAVQSTEILEETINMLVDKPSINKEIIERALTKAIALIAVRYGVDKTSSRDKIQRQQGLTHSQLAEHIYNFVRTKGEDNSLETILNDHLGKNTEEEDQELITETFKKLTKKIN